MNFLLYSEINVLCITLLGIMAYRASKVGIDTNQKKRAFIASICFAISMNFFDFLWGMCVFGAINVPIWLRHFINGAYFVSLAMSAFFWLVFSEIIHTKKIGKPVLYTILFVPLCALIAFLTFANKSGLFFRFEANGEYVHGPLFFLQYVPALIHVLIASVRNIVAMFAPNNYERHETFVTMFSYSVPTFVCAVFQFFFLDVPFLSVTPTISLLLVYTNSLKIQLSLDSLTGIFNRRKLIDTLAEKAKNPRRNKRLFFVFIDIDGFKTLNDRYGHNDGDKALQLVADALNEVCARTGGACARYGGDEFAVVQELDENESISDLCEEIRNAVNERSLDEESAFPVTISVGYGEFMKDAQSVPALIRFADKRMYENKRKRAE